MAYRADEELRGIAAEVAIGVADAGDVEYFDELLKQHDEFASSEISGFRETAARLAFLTDAAPHEGLRSKLLARITAPEAKKTRVLPGFAEEAPGFHTLRSGSGKWRQTEHPGIECMLLSLDPASDLITTLLRLAPGAAYPRHQHTREEQCWVVEGDVRQVDGSVCMKAGDFFRAMPGTLHEPITTENGCTLLIIGSAHDELLD